MGLIPHTCRRASDRLPAATWNADQVLTDRSTTEASFPPTQTDRAPSDDLTASRPTVRDRCSCVLPCRGHYARCPPFGTPSCVRQALGRAHTWLQQRKRLIECPLTSSQPEQTGPDTRF